MTRNKLETYCWRLGVHDRHPNVTTHLFLPLNHLDKRFPTTKLMIWIGWTLFSSEKVDQVGQVNSFPLSPLGFLSWLVLHCREIGQCNNPYVYMWVRGSSCCVDKSVIKHSKYLVSILVTFFGHFSFFTIKYQNVIINGKEYKEWHDCKFSSPSVHV